MAESEYMQENVNGVKLRLKVDNVQNSPFARRFTITFTKNEYRSSFSPSIFAVIFCIIAIIYCIKNLTVLNKIAVIVLLLILFILLYLVSFKVQSESLLIIPGVGVQSTVQYKSHESHLDYVPWNSIDDILINEVITRGRVLLYLTIKTKESSIANMKLIPLFKSTIPRQNMLQRMYAEIQSLLVDRQEDVAELMGSGDRALAR